MSSIRASILSTFAFLTCSVVACGAPVPAGEESAAADTNEPSNGTVAEAQSKDAIDFDLYVNPKFVPCLAAWPNDPSRFPAVHIHVDRGDLNDALTLTGKNIKPGLKFDMFTVERSALNAQASADSAFHGFGLAWYQSDLEANGGGGMNATIKTILLDQIFGFDTDVSLEPRNTFHVGFWFNNPQDAVACGFDASKPTPFNGEHKAGPLAMISVPGARSNLGPLCTDIDWSVSPARCNP
jgi:hypothetical protein